ncbi:aspartate aminotransferase family protein [Aminipila luticellarii]|uniref:(S)-3-amino-2-methylpropionate transaminase n=1 Tax=Aminipila luticellarii TaxID=2507160 RepID=A0A410PUM6_9FIRM|nr:aspartate aminotransferase family protein [Aminipila luticellarii]QAT42633.1 aspartate aminotransferase family protein [Aminipila luticellarii]
MELKNALPKIITSELPGEKARRVIERRQGSIPNAIKCVYPCVMARAEGAMFEDVDGNLFLDWVGGVGVTNVGYSQPAVIKAVQNQAEKYFHSMMNITTHEGYIKLAEKMNEIVPVRGSHKKTMFLNSGAEADENAVKIAKAYTGRPNILVFSGAFHGRTLMTMAMTGKKAYAIGMGPFPDGVYRVEYPYLYRAPKGLTEEEAIQYFVKKVEEAFIECSPAEYIAAVVLEPIQGEGGFVPAPMEWVKAVRKICDEKGILLIADEVQTGFARSGKMFASEYWAESDCAPDILTSAKSIAGGVPLSAVTTRAEIMDKVPAGTIGGTYCGNALACAAALAVIDIMEKEDFPGKALRISEKVMGVWKQWQEKYDVIGDVRGIGCMMGIEFVKDKETKEPHVELVNNIVQEAVKHGLLLESAGTYGNVIRFLAPLVITEEQVDKGLEIYENAIKASL